jgi:DNA polymerase
MKLVLDAGVIVYAGAGEQRRYLFLKNASGWLDTPKGHMEKGENAEEAALRETWEETGIRVRPDPFFRDSIEYWYAENGERTKKRVTFFIAEVASDTKVKISDEHVSYAWLDYASSMKRLSFKDQKELLVRVDAYLGRLEAMHELNREYGALPSKQKAWKLSGRFVAGEGPLNAKVMFIGQAPGRQEDEQGRPFIGISGKLLDRMITLAGLSRRGVYITSVVQFFPPENRLPTDEEAAMCRKFLLRQIEIVSPRLIVLLGSLAAKTLANVDSVTAEHGKLLHVEGRDYFVVLHPAAAVRLKKYVPVMEEDFRKLKGICSQHEK